MTDKKYVIGPFAGEFGYELCYWLPYVRHFVDRVNFLDGEAICLAREDRKYFYKGVDCGVYGVNLNRTYDDWVYNDQDLIWDNPEDIFEDFSQVKRTITDVLGVYSREKPELVTTSKELWSEPRRWCRYDAYEPQTGRCDVIIHMRNKRDNRDIPKHKWIELVEFFEERSETVGIIGTDSDYGGFGRVPDLRGAPSLDLCHYITQADVCIGAISGPMHLASLCGTEHIVAGNPDIPIPEVGTSLEAFSDKWNPFNTPVIYTRKHEFINTVKEFFNGGSE